MKRNHNLNNKIKKFKFPSSIYKKKRKANTELIKKKAREKGLIFSRLARYLGVRPEAIYHLIHNRIWSQRLAEAICEALDESMDKLFPIHGS